MAGLLDGLNDPMKMAMLQMGIGILANNRGNYGRAGPAIGAGLQQGMQGLLYAQAMKKEEDKKRGMQDWLKNMPRATQTPTGAPTGQPLDGGAAGDLSQLPVMQARQLETQRPTQDQMRDWAIQGMEYNPGLANKVIEQQFKDPESNFSKVDPKDYTPESILRFSQTGNYGDLKPFRKAEAPTIKDFIQGEKVSQRQFNPETGQWEEVGTGPRFARQVPSVIMGDGGNKPPAGYRWSANGESLEPIPGGPAANKGVGKPMPATALRMRQDEADALATADSIQRDLSTFRKQIEGGELNLGLGENVASRARNFFGASTENSRNFQSFRATLEKLRNDTLRLNKGVQTEGDAQRAWNELLDNINDEGVVMQRLQELEAINNRAALIRQQNIENIDQNYGRETDVSGHTNMPTAFGNKRTVVKRGKYQGRPVVQYSDGSLEFDDGKN